MANQNNDRKSGNKSSSNQHRAERMDSQSKTSGMGRGWHGDSEGHARAGRQSNKNK